MVRPREFDRDEALAKATRIFWAKGFAATSTDDLIEAMGIGRQSLYNAFGDKRRLYLEALKVYQQKTLDGHLDRLASPASPLDGIRNLLTGLIATDDDLRALGCMGVGSVGEFGTGDPELVQQRKEIGPALGIELVKRIREGQAAGEIDAELDPRDTATFVQMTMNGLQLGARAGAAAGELRRLARFTVDRLRAK